MKGTCNFFLDFLIKSENNSKGINLSGEIIPSNFLIGTIDIRHYLNDNLLKSGGILENEIIIESYYKSCINFFNVEHTSSLGYLIEGLLCTLRIKNSSCCISISF